MTTHVRLLLQLENYWNPNEIDYNGHKCDPFTICDYYFIIGLNFALHDNPYTDGSLITKTWKARQNITFSIGEIMNDTLQATNPLQFDLIDWKVITFDQSNTKVT